MDILQATATQRRTQTEGPLLLTRRCREGKKDKSGTARAGRPRGASVGRVAQHGAGAAVGRSRMLPAGEPAVSDLLRKQSGQDHEGARAGSASRNYVR